jgi:Tol biopolymer transport system component
MALQVGSRLGPYEVTGSLGAGGMGEVYRARDTKLNRDVAIKVLPDLFALDRDRLARFEREAQTLAALNHPNIAHIHGIEGTALVMEFVDGEDLSQRIARGAIPLDEALPIARQIADALEAAHEQGIVHRDLKPANVKVRPDGTVKVLDFGLAKAAAAEGAIAAADAMQSPTFTSPARLRQGYGEATQAGVILGTAAYMAPEQARGKVVDRRADIWAFGAVLYEMLTGRRAFEGDGISDVLASVLKSDPAWSSIPAGTPASIRRLLRRCLEKDPRKRLSAIGDARLDLTEDDQDPVPLTTSLPRARRRALPLVAAAAAGALVMAVAALAVWRTNAPANPAGVQRLSVLGPPDALLMPDSNGVAISPDGRMVAFMVGTRARSQSQLWVRSLDSLDARRLSDDSEAPYLPFWSPDSRTVGYFTASKLKIVPAAGGRAQNLADVTGGRGAAWSAANVIVYAPDTSGPLFRVDVNGGAPRPVTAVDAAKKQVTHRFPSFLPDGDHFLYAALPGRNGRYDIFVGSLSGGAPELLTSLESAPIYAAPGYLLYARQGVLTAQPFDAKARRLNGDPITLEDEPASILDPVIAYTASRAVSAASNGSLAYYSASSQNTLVDWYDLQGRKTGSLALPPGHYERLNVSPDGKFVIAERTISPSESSLWLIDVATGGASQFSSGPGRNGSPVWSPDSSKIVFASDRDGAADFYLKAVGSTSPEQPIYRSPSLFKYPNSWSPDGKWIVFAQVDPVTTQNIYLLPADGSSAPKVFLGGPSRQVGGVISPDGRMMAYSGDETGRYEMYITPFPSGGGSVQVSHGGAIFAWWTPDGRQLLFADESRSVWRATVAANLTVGPPQPVAQLPSILRGGDFAPDRQRYIGPVPERTGPGSITIVQHWRAALGGR